MTAITWHDEADISIHIVAIAHTSREPNYWRERVPPIKKPPKSFGWADSRL